MDHTNTADPHDTPDATSATEPVTPPAAPGGLPLPARLQAQEAQLAAITAQLAELETKLQTTEVALVTRIADVDDDRRDSATRLQRAYHSQRDELTTRLARQRSIMLLLAVVVLLMIGCLAIVGYLGFDAMRQSILAEIAPLEAAIEQLRVNEQAAQTQATRERLAQLSAAVKSISTTVEQLGSEPEDHQARGGQDASSPPPQPTAPPPPPAPAPTSAAPPAPPTAPAATPRAQETPAAPRQTEVTPPAPAAAPAAPAVAEAPPESAATATESPGPESAAAPTAAFEVGDKPFTIQLMGFYSLDDLQRFAHRYALPAQVYYREETYQGRPWFVLIHSLHPTREDANAAVTGLPSALSGLDIWIRKLEPDAEVTPLATHVGD